MPLGFPGYTSTLCLQTSPRWPSHSSLLSGAGSTPSWNSCTVNLETTWESPSFSREHAMSMELKRSSPAFGALTNKPYQSYSNLSLLCAAEPREQKGERVKGEKNAKMGKKRMCGSGIGVMHSWREEVIGPGVSLLTFLPLPKQVRDPTALVCCLE